MSLFRLDKYLADAGIGTRSEVKSYIKKGLVRVNSITIKQPDTKINSETDCIEYNNQPICMETLEYYILNKPAGYVSATKDNTAPTVLSLIESSRKDLFPVGRLDKDTEGLLLITNDGDLAHHLLSPKRHVDKTYSAVIEGNVTSDDITIFKNGVVIGAEDLNIALPADLTITAPYDAEKNLSYIEVTIQEGKFHQVKRMFQAVNKKVLSLKRIQFGSLSLPNDLEPGSFRKLTSSEVEALRNCCHLPSL